MPRKPVTSSAPELPPLHLIRRQRVVFDSDLAALYGVATKVFNQAVRRNAARFPDDFAFQLTAEEVANLKSQTVTSSSPATSALRSQYVTLKAHGGRRTLPWAFTEHGAIMAAMVLRSEHAVAMSVFVVRAFVRMREELLTNARLLKRLAEHDRKLLEHDVVLQDVVEKLLPLLDAPPPPPDPLKRRIGFNPDD